MSWYTSLLIAGLVASAQLASFSRTDPLVLTNVGWIRGQFATDGNYTMFLGIPYAQINPNNPFGDHLFQPYFKEVFEAKDDSAMCPQREQFNNTIAGTLDCLQLNIYVPNTASSSNRLPVMVWIHGGAFQLGSKNKRQFGPKYLIEHDVILVSINYRVGIYGFMCLDIQDVPGNQGLKDQQAAIKWVKDNIIDFGGDVNNIVLFGESAGSASVDLQLRYNKDDSFHKVIMQSGSASSGWAIQEPDYDLAIKLATHLGFETDNSFNAINYLAKSEPLDVIKAVNELSLSIWPCPEKEFIGVKRFINDYAMNIEIPKAKKTPILFGVNSDEWLARYARSNDESLRDLTIIQDNLKEAFNFSPQELLSLENVIKYFYLGYNAMSTENVIAIGQLDTDYNFMYPAKLSIYDYMLNGATDVYHYYFKYSGKRNYSKSRSNTTLGGAFHGDDLGYLFDVWFLVEPEETDKLVLDRMTTMWTNFAKYGDPTPEVTDLIPVKWPKVTDEKSSFLEIGSELRIDNSMLHNRTAFWSLLYDSNITKRKGYKPR